MSMPLPPSRSASTASLAGLATPERSRRRARFSERREAPYGADGAAANSAPSMARDSFVRSHSDAAPSRLRPPSRSNRTWRRERQQLNVPDSLRDVLPQSATLDIETEMGDDGDVDVIDCELIASRHELQRWRLSLTDFHAMLAGGTEAIESYRQEQRRKDMSATAAQRRALDIEAALAAEEKQEAKKKRAGGTTAAPEVSLQTLVDDEQHMAPLPQADAGARRTPEPLWRTVLAWPWRALKRAWAFVLHLVG